MSINALYVYTSTAFIISTPSTIEQLIPDTSGSYTVTPRSCSGQFTLGPGVYRYAFEVSLTPVGGAEGESARGDSLTGFVITPMGTKNGGPDPSAQAAAAALGISIDSVSAFLMNAEPAVTLAPAAAQHAHH